MGAPEHTKRSALTLLLLLPALLLSACLDDGTQGQEDATETRGEPPGNEPPGNEPPGNEPPVSELPPDFVPMGDCDSLSQQQGVVFCEPWESADWWRTNGFLAAGAKTRDYEVLPEDVDRTEVVDAGCVSGSCLKVNMRALESGALSVHWPLKNAGIAPEELYMSYYLKLAPNFDATLCYADTGGTGAGAGGKFPGLADPRDWPDPDPQSGAPGYQCGNGGNFPNGTDCWTMRTTFRKCSDRVDACIANPNATTRFGSYLYYPGQNGWDNDGMWDDDDWGQGGSRSTPRCSSAADLHCGVGYGGVFDNDTWYHIEMRVKMNTPGQADGIVQGWVNGELSYDKQNMIWRDPGHDALHVREAWLNVHAGGEFVGLCETSYIMLDEMVLSTQRIGMQ